MSRPALHIYVGIYDAPQENHTIFVDMSKRNRKIRIGVEYTTVFVYRDGQHGCVFIRGKRVLTMIGDSVKVVRSFGACAALNMDKLPNLDLFYVESLSREQSRYIPDHLANFRSRILRGNYLKSLSNIKTLDCATIPNDLPPNLEKLRYRRYLDTKMPESINEIYCRTGRTTALPRNLVSLSILRTDVLLKNIADICPNLRNITIYDSDYEDDDVCNVFGASNNDYAVHSAMSSLHSCDEIVIDHDIIDNLPRSIQYINATSSLSFGDYDFSDFPNLEKIRCTYSDFTPPPNLKTLVLDICERYMHDMDWADEEFIGNFFAKFNYIETLSIPNLPLPLYNELKERCIVGTLFLSEINDSDIFDLQCEVIVKNIRGSEMIHSKSIVEIVDSPYNKYQIKGDNKDIVVFKYFTIEYPIVSRREIIDISGVTVNLIGVIVPGSFVNSRAKSARK